MAEGEIPWSLVRRYRVKTTTRILLGFCNKTASMIESHCDTSNARRKLERFYCTLLRYQRSLMGAMYSDSAVISLSTITLDKNGPPEEEEISVARGRWCEDAEFQCGL